MVSDDSRKYNDSRNSQQRAREQARAKAARDRREWRQQAEQSEWQRRQRGHQQLQNQPWRSKFADLPQSHDQLQERKQVYRQPRHPSQTNQQGQPHASRRQNGQYTEKQRQQAELLNEQERRARQQVAQRAAQQRAQEQAARQRVIQDQHETQRAAQERAARQDRRHLQLQGMQTNQQLAQQRAAQQPRAMGQQAAQQHEAQRGAAPARSAQAQTVQQREAQLRAKQRAAAQRAAEQVQLQNARSGQILEDDFPGIDDFSESSGYDQTANQYSRDSYSARPESSVSSDDFYEPSSAHDDYSRGSARYTQHRGSTGDDRPQIPKKLIAIIVAIFAVVVILFIINPLGCGDTSGSSSKSSSSAASASKTATTAQPALPTPIMAESSGIKLHSAVAMKDLTEILIHNASYSYANEITTELTEATNTEILAAHGTKRDAASQPTGDQWMTGEFIRCFRDGNAGPVMSAIDCGGKEGSTVYAPVSGKVVLVKEYKLYDQFDDYRVHIQPTGRTDLDVVLIHLTDVSVKAGDTVTAGETPIGKIRDVEQYVGDSMQLKPYTAQGDRGNHTHIQVNNANDPEYHGLDDLKASSSSSVGDAQIAS